MRRPSDAAEWAVRRAAGPLSVEDRARLADWLAVDRRRKAALLRAEVGLSLINRAQAVLPTTVPAPRLTRRRAVGFGVGAMAAAASAFYLLPGGERLTTERGEVRQFRLADTSVVMLNTQSRVRVALEPGERRIALDQGEAWFRVAHNHRRPFVVTAADLRVRAVGTAFSVRRMAAGVDVLVTDGVVEVWRADRPDQRARVSRDHRVFVPNDSVAIAPVAAGAAIERTLAWRSKRLVLAGEALDYAVEEINRYNAVQLRIDDPALGRMPIYGYFRVDDPLAFAKLIATGSQARVERDGDTLRLIPQIS